eukprot:9623401-Lingulodinium_polyedra.AAC.1
MSQWPPNTPGSGDLAAEWQRDGCLLVCTCTPGMLYIVSIDMGSQLPSSWQVVDIPLTCFGEDS